jgi:GNAT superfamily N-acetyltransferase
MSFTLRKAATSDVDRIEVVVDASVRGLAKGIYSDREIELSIQTVFGVDLQLIDDETYFVAEIDERIVGCGGWSKRKTLFGATRYEDSRDDAMLDPATEPAKIRAFFVHPEAARKGIGRAILEACESEARAAGFRSAEMMATLPGIPQYEACGYQRLDRVDVPLGTANEWVTCFRMRKAL